MGTLAGDHSFTKFAYLSRYIGLLEGAFEVVDWPHDLLVFGHHFADLIAGVQDGTVVAAAAVPADIYEAQVSVGRAFSPDAVTDQGR